MSSSRAASQYRLLLASALLGCLVVGLAAPLPAAPPPGISALKAGMFLVAAPTLRDSNFVETVILLLQHGAAGAAGLIVNRPSPAPLKTLMPEFEEKTAAGAIVYLGGPVARWQIMVLLRPPGEVWPEVAPVLEGVAMSGDRGVLERLLGDPQAEFRVYAGYSGWAPGQLEAEVAAGGWTVVEADAATVFSATPESVWSRLVRRGSAELADGAATPEPLAPAGSRPTR